VAASRTKEYSVAKHGILLVLAATALAPIAVLATNSLRSNDAMLVHPFGWPLPPLFSNYVSAWDTAGYSVAFVNSLIVSGGTVLGVCTFSALAAYGLARLRVPGSGIILTYLLIALTLPTQLYLVPVFIAWVHLHLTNNLLGLIFIYWGMWTPFGVLLLRSFFISLPVDFEDSARVDGCNELQVLRRVVVPIAWPSLVSLAVIIGVWSWNEFLFAVTMLTNESVQTVAVRYFRFNGIYSTNYADVAAGGLIACSVTIFFFLILQRRFVQGLSQGGLKG
jgi:raffinose/stachyose/melibiose transport system permease protein